MKYDIVLFGGTGFTGGLTAEYLALHAPPSTRWALAGRNQAKLEALRDRLASLNSACGELPLLRGDVGDPGSMRALAEATRVVITTVGPYARYGEPLVAACADAGTDYTDLTGEPGFVDEMYVRYHRRALDTGARIVHACGFDSIPHDLGAYFTVQQLPEGVPLRVEGFVRIRGGVSGGTVRSGFAAASHLPSMARAMRERRRLEDAPAGRRVSVATGRSRFGRSIGVLGVPFPSLDPLVISRSARALDRYGPDFRYGHFVVARSALPTAASVASEVGAAALARLRRAAPVEGPTAEQRAKNWFKVTFVGEVTAGQHTGERVVTEVSGGDPGYGETSKMLGESALCLAHDDLKPSAGQVTTAVAMGNALIDRLQRAGMPFRVLP